MDSQYHPELVDDTAFVADNATIRGRVRIGAESSVWFGAVIRGDTDVIEIGDRSNVQDLCVLHADAGFPCRIGDDVTIGHAAVVHGATIENGAMVGMRAVVLNGARIGAGSIVGAGALIGEGKEIPPNSLAVGMPARVIRTLTEKDQQRLADAAVHYIEAAKAYRL